MRNKIWRPVNTYGLLFIGVCVSFVFIYAIVAL